MRNLAATSPMELIGAKGGGGGGGVEAPDTLHSIATAKILDIVSEGPIVGPIDGLKSVVLGGTPIQNPDGSTNFQNYSVDWRLGTSDQTFMPGFPSVENEIAVGVALTSDTPWSKAVQNTQLTAVRIRFGVPAIEVQDKSNGNIDGYKIDYAIDVATDGGSFTQVLTNSLSGKAASLYERTERINLPVSKTGWVVRVRRLTPNKHDSSIQDTVNIEALTEVIDRKLRYPNTAVFGMQFDAKSFSSIPTRGYLVRGRIIAIPSNYDPESRTYFGTWDGTFKQGWTNNPAWIFRDLALHPRYGCGRSIDASALDKWSLYEIARYCDVMVPDGLGGMEPRFTCNTVIQSQADAFKVLQDVAGIFRGQAYWGAGSVIATADMPMEPAHVYTQANVIDGEFNYSGTSRKSRYTVAQVSYNDKTNQFKQAVEYVQDDDGLARYGVIKASITAFGTTSQGQAHRLGLWAIHSSRLETQTLSFSVGLDGTMAAPGDVIAVADAKKAGRRIGGRIRGMSDMATVVLDKAPVVKVGDDLTVIMPDGFAQKRAVSSVNGDTIKVNPAFTDKGVSGAVWMVESDDLVSQLFRVISIAEEADNGQVVYTMNCAQHEPGKYALIDNGAQIKKRPITVVPPSVQPPPANVRITQNVVIDQGTAKTTMTVAWDAADKATSYLAKWRKDNGEWVSMPVTGALSLDVVGVYSGMYDAQVRAVNALGVTSIPGMSQPTAIKGKTGAPPAVALLTASLDQMFAIEINWGFPADGSANDTQRTDIWQSRTPAFSDGVLQGSYAYPTNKAVLMGLAAGQAVYFWARLVDTSGNIGPWYPVETGAGVKGMSNADAIPLLEALVGKITDSQLGKDLLSKVDAVPGLVDEVAALNTSVAQIPQIKADVSGLQKNVSGLSTSASSLSTAVTAIPGIQTDVKGLSTAVSSLLNVDLPALNTSVDDLNAHVSELHDQVFPWMAGDDGSFAGNDGALVGVVSEQSMREEADLALGQRIEGVGAALNAQGDTIRASVIQEMQARADGDMAQAALTTALRAEFNDNAASVSQQLQTQADATSAVASDVSALKTSVAGNTAAINTLSTTSSDADAALAKQITNLSTSTVEGIASAVSTEQKARVDGDAANAQAITSLNTTVKGNTSAISTLSTASADADKALAQSISDLKTQTGKDISAAVATESKARTDGDAANAKSITDLTTKFNDNAASVQTQIQAGADANAANASAISKLGATVDGNTSAISSLQKTTSDADAAMAQQIAGLTAQVNPALAGDDTGMSGNDSALAGVYTEADARAEADLALAQKIESVQAALNSQGDTLLASVQSESLARTDGDGALAKSITSLNSSFNDNAAAVARQLQAQSDATSAVASSVASLTTDVKGNKSAISDLATATSSADSALGQRITDLSVSTAADTKAQIATEQKARVDGDSANADAITSLRADYNANSASVQAQIKVVSDSTSANALSITNLQSSVKDANAVISTESKARSDGDTALTQSITNLSSTVDKNAAAVTTLQKTVTDGDTANAQAITDLRTQTAKDISSAVSTEATARASGDKANADAITTLQSTVKDTSATVQTQGRTLAALDGQLSASYTIKAQVVNGQTYAASMALGADGSGNTSILFSASTFAVIDPSSGKVSSPFAIQNGQVFIASGFISNGSITNAQIANGSIDNAKIQNGAIDSAKIQNGAITYAQIGDAQIGGAKIWNAGIATAHIGEAQIDTLRIAQGAVCAGQSGSGRGAANVWVNSIGSGSQLLVTYGAPGSGAGQQINLLIDGGAVAYHITQALNDYASYAVTLSPGTHMITVQIQNSLSPNVSLNALTFQR